MADSPITHTEPESTPRRRIRSSTFWIGLSFLLSGGVMVWSFTLPFRQDDPLLSSADGAAIEPSEPIDLAERARHRRSRAEEFRDAAIKLDQEFMRTIRERRQVSEDLPGIVETREKWDGHVGLVKRQAEQLKEAKEGSLEWQHRQELLESLQDGPK